MLSRKGAFRVRISFNGLLVDLVVTHLIGEKLDDVKERNVIVARDVNEYHRQGQTKELLRFIESSCSGSDVVVLGGDLNFDETHESYNLVTGANFQDTGATNGGEGKRTTWGNPENTVGNSTPQLLDYVFVRNNKDRISLEASSTIHERAFQ